MKLDEARNLKVGDILKHRFLKTEWVVIEARPIKSNEGRFIHKLQIGMRTQKFTEKGLHLWNTS